MTGLSSRTSDIQFSDKVISERLSLNDRWMLTLNSMLYKYIKKGSFYGFLHTFSERENLFGFSRVLCYGFVDRFIGLLPNWVKFMDSAAIKCLSTRERYEPSPFTIWKSI